MKYTLVEQVDKPTWDRNRHSSTGRQYLKRQAARAMRRIAKFAPEEAPKKPRYKGWYW